VVKGYAQRRGIDFNEVFTPVERLHSVRLLLALAAHNRWVVHHMDVKSVFLNRVLQEEVYVLQPVVFIKSGEEHKVLGLCKALYSLHQVPRAWNVKLVDTLLSLDFRRCPSEPAIYIKQVGGQQLVIGVYVDDIMIIGGSNMDIMEFKQEMAKVFSMSDLGLLHYYFGIEVKQDQRGISLSQGAYALKILDKCGLRDCNPCQVPMEPRLKLSKQSTEPAVDQTLYRSVVGSLRYLVNTHPDISFSVGYVSRFLENPCEDHMGAVKHIVRYITGTHNWGLWFGRER
jgi:hypothetical protein